MLKFRVIPIILVDGPNVVKGSEFNNWRKVGTLIPALNVYNTRDVDELILLDTRASRSLTDFNMRILAQALGRISVPLAVGGGITSVDQVAELIDNGADKVVIGSGASTNPHFLEKAASRFGSQACVTTIDVKNHTDGTSHCYIHGGTEHLPISPNELAHQHVAAGAGEIIVNSISHDGKMNGFDIDLVGEIAEAINIPVVGAGGAGSPSDFLRLATETQAQAAAAASIFVFTETTPQVVREALAEIRVPVRNTSPKNVRTARG